MVEDAPATLNMVVEDVSWELFEEWFQRGIYLRNSLSVSSMSSTPYDRVVIRCPSTRPIFGAASVCSTLTEKLKVNKFVLALALEFRFYFGY
jgi:hypothetical protein